MSEAYVVLATQLNKQVNAHYDPRGQLRVDIKKYRRGDVVTDLSDDDIERHLRCKAIALKSDIDAQIAAATPVPPGVVSAAPPLQPEVAPEFEARQGEVLDRPKQIAPKDDWVEYAVAQGWDRDNAEAVTKNELIEQTK